MMIVRTLIYLFICCCGMVTFFIILKSTLQHMSADTLFGFIYGMFFSLGILAVRDWLGRRGVVLKGQDDRVPGRRS